MSNLVRHNIIIAGACNSGKSTLLNAILNRQAAVVSDVPGTTTDPNRHLIEIPGVGACRITDTPGTDDNDAILGEKRISVTEKSIAEADILLMTVGFNAKAENSIAEIARKLNIPVITVATKADAGNSANADVATNATDRTGIPELISLIRNRLNAVDTPPPLFGRLVGPGDTVVLVMPQDSEAPKDRLILPQSLVIRNLLDINAIPVCTTPDTYSAAMKMLGTPPALVITDSQVFAQTYEATPAGVPLTSFSILMANHKGDLATFVRGANKLPSLKGKPVRILIAQACTHVPEGEDIGTVKLPRLLRSYLGEQIDIEWCYGRDFPENLPDFDIIVHCGACMFTRAHVLNRLREINLSGTPVTNYGLAIAACRGILGKIALP